MKLTILEGMNMNGEMEKPVFTEENENVTTQQIQKPLEMLNVETAKEKDLERIDPDNPLPMGSFFEKQAEKERMAFPYPCLVVLLYLLMGFSLKLWHPGWIIFLTIPIYYLPKKERSFMKLMANPVMVTIIYLILGCCLNLWHPGWLIFLAIPLFQSAVRK